MAGRRLRAAIQSTVEHAWGSDLHIIISGMTNSYSSYITTYEEYQIQRYEGASTIFGPHSLEAYIQVTSPRNVILVHQSMHAGIQATS